MTQYHNSKNVQYNIEGQYKLDNDTNGEIIGKISVNEYGSFTGRITDECPKKGIYTYNIRGSIASLDTVFELFFSNRWNNKFSEENMTQNIKVTENTLDDELAYVFDLTKSKEIGMVNNFEGRYQGMKVIAPFRIDKNSKIEKITNIDLMKHSRQKVLIHIYKSL
jgi:hypothetical protein